MTVYTRFFKHKLQIVFLFIFIIFSNLQGFALDTWGGSIGTAPSLSGSTYTINKCSELAWLANQVNTGNTFIGYTFNVADDLDLNNYNWTPIGNATYSFQGTFNGQGHKIYNLSVNNSTGYAGLFGNAGNSASISNTSIQSGTITSSGNYAGSLVGNLSGNPTINNCNSNASVSTSGNQYTGGLIGYSSNGFTCTNCFATGNVVCNGSGTTGGFIGAIDNNTTSIVANCYASGLVSSLGETGGFVGHLDMSDDIYIVNCYATGPVLYYSYNSGSGGVGGGFVGLIKNKANISYCYASGSVYGFNQVGPFIGKLTGNKKNVTNCYFDIQGTGYTSDVIATGYPTTTLASNGTSSPFYGITGWTLNNNYLPELTNFKSGLSSGYTLSSPAITVPAITPTSDQKAWSSLSSAPLFFTNPDKSILVANVITAPLYSSAVLSNRINWYGAPRTGDIGSLSFDNNSGVILPAMNGNYNFLSQDNSGRTKPFFVHINQTKVYFVRAYNGNDGGTVSGVLHDGTTWARAFQTIQYAVEKANIQSPKFAVWVAAGNYSYNSAYPYSTGENFRMYDGVDVYGSFKEDSTTNNGYAGMDTRFANGYSIMNGSSSRSVLTPYTNPFSKFTTWDGFCLTGCSISGYAATVPGKGWLMNAVLRNNNAALTLLNGAQATNILAANNTGTSLGAIVLTDTAKLVNATIAYNKGPAISISGTLIPKITSSIIWGNSSNFDVLADTAKININYSALSCAPDLGGKWVTFGNSNNNIDLYHRSPNFKAPGKSNYELSLISPCIDKGDPTQNSSSIDVRGMPRFYYGTTATIDMGAYQKQPNDGIIVSGNNTFTYFKATMSVPGISTLTGSEVLVKPAATLDASASSPKPKTLMLQDDNANAPLVKGTITADSILYVRNFSKYCSNGTTLKWNAFGIPFTSCRLDSLDGMKIENSVRLDQYSEATRSATGAYKQGWKPYLGTDFTNASLSYFNRGRGYMGIINSKVPLTSVCNTLIVPAQKGTTLTDSPSTVSIPVTRTAGMGWVEEGWNFIANPFCETAIFANNTGYWPSNSSYTPVYIYQPETDTYNIILFSTFNSIGLSAFGTCFIKTDVTSQVQMQPSTLSSSLRVSEFNAKSSLNNVFRIQIDNKTTAQNTYVIFDDTSHSDAVENEDYPSISTIYTNATGSSIPLAVNTLPFKGSSVSVPLTIEFPQAGSYTLSLPESDDYTKVDLVESNGTTHNITNETFTISTNQASTLNYTLLFDRSNSTNNVQNSANSDVIIAQNKENVTVTSSSQLNKIYIYTMQGQLIQVITNSGTSAQFNLPASGTYIIKIATEKGITNKKLVVQP